MASKGLNKVFVIGRLTRDPETRYTKDGKEVATFQLAVNMPAAKGQERTEFIRCVAWEKLAEIVTAHLGKGAQVYIEGRLQTRSWEDPSGGRRYMTEVVASELIMLGRPKDDGDQLAEQAGAWGEEEGELPF